MIVHNGLSATSEVALHAAENLEVAVADVRLVHVEHLVEAARAVFGDVDQFCLVAVVDDVIVTFAGSVFLPSISGSVRSL